jgi:hypothetical protein
MNELSPDFQPGDRVTYGPTDKTVMLIVDAVEGETLLVRCADEIRCRREQHRHGKWDAISCANARRVMAA